LSSSRCAAVFFACASASSRSRSRNDGIAAGVPRFPRRGLWRRPVAMGRLVRRLETPEKSLLEGSEKTVGGDIGFVGLILS
jgi:hypothetical protein